MTQLGDDVSTTTKLFYIGVFGFIFAGIVQPLDETDRFFSSNIKDISSLEWVYHIGVSFTGLNCVIIILIFQRVLFQVTVKVDSRDWRSHLEQMHTYRDGIEQALESTKSQLDKLHTDVSRTLEKISSREKYLNSQLEAPLADLRQLQDNLAATKEQYRQVNFKTEFDNLKICWFLKFKMK